jgi:hypothetical protein
LAFLEKKMGNWSLDDARNLLGEPVRQRDAFVVGQNGATDGVIYAFRDPTAGMKEFELNFSKAGTLRAVYAYPQPGTTHLKDAQQLWGRNYREIRNTNGTRSYAYNDRRLIVLTDKNGTVINIGIYLP